MYRVNDNHVQNIKNENYWRWKLWNLKEIPSRTTGLIIFLILPFHQFILSESED